VPITRAIVMRFSSSGWRRTSIYVFAELGQLVEEQHAIVCETDLAGARHRAAADQTRVGDRVMRRAEGPRRDQRAPVHQARHAMHLGGLDRLLEGHRRQDCRQPLGQHRLARTRRPDHQDVVAARGGDLERALGLFLAAHFAEVDVVLAGGGEQLADVGGVRLDLAQALEKIDRVAQRFDSQHRRSVARDRRLCGIFERQDDAGVMFRAREQRARQRTADSLDPTIERKLALDQVIAHPLGAERAGVGGQDRERDRQVERRTLLASVGRRQVDRYLAIGKFVAGILDRRLDPFLGLAHGALGEADGPELRHSARDVNLDFDREGVHPGKRA
jgi:hypothetical protein